MDLKTKRAICLMVVIASILTIVGTISYAYFSAMGDMRRVDTSLNTGAMSVIFDDNDEGIGGELNFGESITKKFTIENTGTVDATVRMNWDKLINTYMSGSLTYTLSYSENESGVYTELIIDEEVPRTPIPMSLRKLLANNLTIPAGEKYYYNLEITLNNLADVDQTTDLKAIFNSEFIVEDINAKPITPNFAEPATTDEGVFEMEDNYGTSYYFRGAVENNYVRFARYYWRIIRLNGDGSLRIIYDGTTPHANGESSDDRFTKVSQSFNALYGDAKYVGWMFGGAQGEVSTIKAQAQLNETNSAIKKVVDEWYKTNIQDEGYGQYVSDTLFCNDRQIETDLANSNGGNYSSYTTLGYGANKTLYKAASRNGYKVENPLPTFKCEQKNDAFTVSDTSKGNGASTYPVGLITADEIVAAGSGKYGIGNNQYYLYKSSSYYTWALSPGILNTNGYAIVFDVGTSGDLDSSYVHTASGAVAPVINLSAEYVSTLKGTGTAKDPYTA